MKLTAAQQKLVEDNLGLVGKVIAQKVHGLHNIPYYTYDDLFQIGCIGLSKAAATDKGGVFSTYAYRLIWNEICDALV
ncbi:MAG: sigma-70 family RNA polymerase sigma factor, partial [Clostridia bacterium]|nr:sigma-70 family RNA polymerase sigma factor [Clostridia bacterium]